MASRYGLEIRAAQGGDAAGLAELLRASGHPVAAEALAERIEALRQGPGVALVAVEWGPPSGLVVLHWYRSLSASLPTAQITTLTADRDRYKAWHDKHSNSATALPATDASNRGGQSSEQTTLSTASSSALDQFLRRNRTTSRA